MSGRESLTQPGRWDGLVVICAGTPWGGHRLPERPLAERLAEHLPVLYADPPISRRRLRRDQRLAESVTGPWPKVVRPGLAHLPPVVLPGKDRPGMHLLADRLVRARLRAAADRLTTSVRAVISISPHRWTFGACGEARRVFWALDDYTEAASLVGVPAGRLRRGVTRHADAADVVVAASAALGESFAARGYEALVVPNGCDVDAFAACDVAPLPDDVGLPPPIAGFVGQLSDRIDLSLLDAVASRGHSLLLVGPRQQTFDPARIEALLSRPNVRWVGAKPFEELASYLRVIDVGLVPYADTGFNRASFPLKTLEYLAAGRAAVATNLPAVHWLGTDLITTAIGPRDFAAAVEAALAVPRTPSIVDARRVLAREHDWSQRATRWVKILRDGGAG